jgi:hypothetical protein
MRPETDLLMKLADLYACVYESGDPVYVGARRYLASAIDSIVAERDTLAAGVEEYHCRLPAHRDEAVLKAALEVTRRLKAASEPAKPPAVPAATVEPEYDLVEVHPDGRAWRYRPGMHIGECTSHFPGNWKPTVVYGRCRKDTGAVRFTSMPAALAWWRETHPLGVVASVATATGGPKSAEYAEPAKPEPTDLRTLVEGMNHCIDAAIGSLIGAARDKNLLTIDALRAIARVVEELAKEAKR